MAGKLNDKIHKAKSKATEISHIARKKTSSYVDMSKAQSVKAAQKTTETIDNSPLAMVAGGMALGILFAALLPKTDRENKLFGNTSRKLGNSTRNITDAAKSAGAAHLTDIGLNHEHLREQIQGLFQKAFDTVKSATSATHAKMKNKGSD